MPDLMPDLRAGAWQSSFTVALVPLLGLSLVPDLPATRFTCVYYHESPKPSKE